MACALLWCQCTAASQTKIQEFWRASLAYGEPLQGKHLSRAWEIHTKVQTRVCSRLTLLLLLTETPKLSKSSESDFTRVGFSRPSSARSFIPGALQKRDHPCSSREYKTVSVEGVLMLCTEIQHL